MAVGDIRRGVVTRRTRGQARPEELQCLRDGPGWLRNLQRSSENGQQEGTEERKPREPHPSLPIGLL